MRVKRQLWLVVLLAVLGVAPASAQNYVRLWPNGATGVIDANGEAVTVANAREMGTIGIQIAGTKNGTLVPQCSLDGTNWQAVNVALTTTPGTQVTSITTTDTGIWTGAIAGCRQVRVVATAWTSGSATVTINTIQTGGGSGGSATLTGDVTVGDVGITSIAAGDNNIGNVDVASVPTDPFGANADAASATGSISAKLRFIAGTGIPITGTVTVGSHAVTNAGTFAVQAAQSGTWTVQPGNTANTTAWLVTGTGGTFPATQSGTWTVQPGNTANTTAWLFAGGLTNNGAAPGATNIGALTVIANASAPSWTEGRQVLLSSDLSGALRVAGAVSCSNCSGTGASKVDDAAMGIATDSVAPTGFLADQTSPDSVNEGDVGIARMTLARIALGTIWDAAGNERGANVNASNQLEVAVGNTVTVGSHAVTNAGTFVVQVDGAALTSLQLTDDMIGVEDAAETAGGGLARVGTVRRDTAASSADTTGDNATLNTDANGLVWVRIGASDVSASGGTSLADDADFTDGTTAGTPIGGVAESATPSTVTEGDFGWAAITLNRALKVTLYSAAGAELTPSSDVVEDAAETAGGSGPMLMTVRRDTAASSAGTTGDNATLNTDAAGRVWVTGTTLEDVASADGAQGLAVFAIRDDTLDVRSGTEGDFEWFHTNADGALWAIDVNSAAALTSIQLLDDVVFVDDAAFTPASSKGYAMGLMVDDTATDSVDEGDFGVPRMTATRLQYVVPAAFSLNGASTLKYTSAGSTEDEHNVCSGPCNLYSVTVTNTNAAARYLRCADIASTGATTPGTSTPVLDLAIPGATTGAGFASTFPVGAGFSTGLTCWAVTGAADTDVAEVAANEVKIFYTFKS